MDGFVRVNGYLWPAEDKECRRVVFTTTRDMEHALKYVKKRDVCVQAGGNCGVWPKYLANQFGIVFTFEPDEKNYRCLEENVTEDNIITANVALGAEQGRASLEGSERNCGAYQIASGDDFNVITIDSLGLDALDYLCLDIEGYELNALKGGEETITKFRPVIQLEDKGLSAVYGSQKGDVEVWLGERGYEVVGRVHRDVILAHSLR